MLVIDGKGIESLPCCNIMLNLNTVLFPTDETSQPEDGSKIFWDQHDDREQRDFVDCGWDNIGSFDDLDRIFRSLMIFISLCAHFNTKSSFWILL